MRFRCPLRPLCRPRVFGLTACARGYPAGGRHHPGRLRSPLAPLQVPPNSHADPLGTAQLHEQQALVRKALAELPAEQKVALELAYFGGLTQQEISALLHEPLGTVHTRIRLGMQKLRRSLKDRV